MVALLALPHVAAAQQAETIEYYGQDVVRIVFDAYGNVIGRQDFTPFGTPVQVTPPVPKEGFGGQEKDDESNQAYFHARMLQARTGRFARVDPILDGILDPQLWNRFAYANNQPLNLTDPSGLSTRCDDSGCHSGCAYVDDCGNGGDPGGPDDPWIGGGTGLPGPCSAVVGPCQDRPPHRRPPPRTGGDDSNGDDGDDNDGCGSQSGLAAGCSPPPPGDPPKCDPLTGKNCAPSDHTVKNFFKGIKDAWNRGYFGCMAGEMREPVVSHGSETAAISLAQRAAPDAAGLYYWATDARFTAFGRTSKVLVPRLAGHIVETLEMVEGLGWVYFDAEVYGNLVSGNCNEYIR
jgi:RHS repeat-associated protein